MPRRRNPMLLRSKASRNLNKVGFEECIPKSIRRRVLFNCLFRAS
jgi:hypothetical protein